MRPFAGDMTGWKMGEICHLYGGASDCKFTIVPDADAWI